MNLFDSLKPELLHHAYIVEGNREESFESLCLFCEDKLKTSIKANPDFWYESVDRFTILHARTLREMQMKRTLGERKIFVVSFNFITREAQNALLKVLEEPTVGTHVFILTPSSNIFLDTVLSRVSILRSKKNTETISADKFLKASYDSRSKIVAKMIKDIKDEKISKSEAIAFVQDISHSLHKNLQKNPTETAKKLKNLQAVESYLQDNSSSVKILLEYTATLA